MSPTLPPTAAAMIAVEPGHTFRSFTSISMTPSSPFSSQSECWSKIAMALFWSDLEFLLAPLLVCAASSDKRADIALATAPSEIPSLELVFAEVSQTSARVVSLNGHLHSLLVQSRTVLGAVGAS